MVWPERGDHHEAGSRHRALEKHAAVEAPVVFVADQNQQRYRKSLQIYFHVPQRRALGLQIQHRQRVALRGMFGQHLDELGIAARVFVLLGLARRAVGIVRRRSGEILDLEHLAGFARRGAHLLDDLRVGARAIAAAGGCYRDAALRIMDADMQRGRRAHRMPHHVRSLDFERIHQRDYIVARDILTVLRAIFRHVGGRIAALAVGDAAVCARKEPHLRLPGAPIAGIFMHEDDGRALARLLVIQSSAIARGYMRHLVLRKPAAIICTLVKAEYSRQRLLISSRATLDARRAATGRRKNTAGMFPRVSGSAPIGRAPCRGARRRARPATAKSARS